LKWLESIDLKEVVIDENSQIRRIWYYPLWKRRNITRSANYIRHRSLDPALNWITGRKAMLKKRSYC
jgi:hypothetical protein